jgi:hypothetical protein
VGGDPGQVVAEAVPEVVVASVGEWLAVAVAQERVDGQDGAARQAARSASARVRLGLMGCHRAVPPFPRSNNTHSSVSRSAKRRPRTPLGGGRRSPHAGAAAGCPGRCRCRWCGRRRRSGELMRGQRAAGGGQPAGFRAPVGGAGGGVDEAVGDGAVVEGAGGAGEALASVGDRGRDHDARELS